MKQDIKELWVKALRSGEYKQAKRVLHNDDGYCCLGVLCDLHSKITNTDQWKTGLDMSGNKVYFYLGFSSRLPEAVMNWAGLNHNIPYVDDISLAALNDGKKNYIIAPKVMLDIEPQTFEQIADRIEKYL